MSRAEIEFILYLFFRFHKMRWGCKICNFESDKRIGLLKHYRLKHGNVGFSQSIPCLYTDCPSFKTFNFLRTHLSWQHVKSVTPKKVLSFSCLLCSSSCFHSESQYFEYLRSHLRTFEVVVCVFKNCSFQYKHTVYSSFATHTLRKHFPQGREDFKSEVLKRYSDPSVAQDESLFVEGDLHGETEPLIKE